MERKAHDMGIGGLGLRAEPVREAGAAEVARVAAPFRSTAEGALPEWQQAVIRGAVHGLAGRLQKRPRDAEGWLRLMISRVALGEERAAREELARALASFSDDPAMQARIAADARLLGVTQD
jgi:cytochrome c-type biogenesis protein CcmH